MDGGKGMKPHSVTNKVFVLGLTRCIVAAMVAVAVARVHWRVLSSER